MARPKSNFKMASGSESETENIEQMRFVNRTDTVIIAHCPTNIPINFEKTWDIEVEHKNG